MTVSTVDLAQDILEHPAMSAIFLTTSVQAGRDADVREALSDVPSLTRAVAFRTPELRLTSVVGVGSDFWDRAYGDLPRPTQLHPFVPLAGARHSAPATSGDVFFHLRAARVDPCFEVAHRLMQRFAGLLEVVDEVHGFRYHDERDLLGFVDGTESPSHPRESVPAALVADDPPYEGSSYLVVQKYVHDLVGLGRAARRGTRTGHRSHQARRHRTARRREAPQLPCRGEHDHRS